MDFIQIKELITLIDNSDLAFFELSDGNNHIKMDKSLSRGVLDVTGGIIHDNSSIEGVEKKSIDKFDTNEKEKIIKEEVMDGDKAKDNSLKLITSPMVGTFYSSAAPDTPVLAEVGDTVTKGKVVCIIEAMKLMNEIECEYNGEIVECLVKNGDMVEYGQPLFKIREV